VTQLQVELERTKERLQVLEVVQSLEQKITHTLKVLTPTLTRIGIDREVFVASLLREVGATGSQTPTKALLSTGFSRMSARLSGLYFGFKGELYNRLLACASVRQRVDLKEKKLIFVKNTHPPKQRQADVRPNRNGLTAEVFITTQTLPLLVAAIKEINKDKGVVCGPVAFAYEETTREIIVDLNSIRAFEARIPGWAASSKVITDKLHSLLGEEETPFLSKIIKKYRTAKPKVTFLSAQATKLGLSYHRTYYYSIENRDKRPAAMGTHLLLSPSTQATGDVRVYVGGYTATIEILDPLLFGPDEISNNVAIDRREGGRLLVDIFS